MPCVDECARARVYKPSVLLGRLVIDRPSDVLWNPRSTLSLVCVCVVCSAETRRGRQVSESGVLDMLARFVVAPCATAHPTGVSSRVEIDTARMYQHGGTEEVLGRVLDSSQCFDLGPAPALQ